MNRVPPPTGTTRNLQAADLVRRLSYLMLFRLVLVTLILGATVVGNLRSPDDLVSPTSLLLFGIIGATYLLSLVYLVLLRRVRDLRRFGDVQIGVDLLLATLLTWATGTADSGFAVLYLLGVIGGALIRYRRGALVAAALSTLSFGAISWLAARQILPPFALVPAAGHGLIRQLVIDAGVLTAIALLAAMLAEQVRDVGERAAQQRSELEDLALLNEGIIRSLASGLVTIGPDRSIVSFNPAASEITGIARDQVLGRRLAQIFPELDALIEKEPASRADRLHRANVTTHRADGRPLPLGVSVVPLLSRLAVPIGEIIHFQDLTDLRQLEEAMRRSERLAALGQLAAGIAHEVRNPLAAISGSVELLRDPAHGGEEIARLVEIVLREVDRLNRLVGEFLEFARPPALERMPLDLTELVRETVAVFARDPILERRPVDLDASADVRLEVLADPAQLRQVLWNLLKNAAEAAAGGDEPIRVACRREAGGRRAELQIHDDGPGIPAEDGERIFEPFYTTKDRGTGLGLAIVHRIVTEHGGVIEVESGAGRGTTMRIALPLTG